MPLPLLSLVDVGISWYVNGFGPRRSMLAQGMFRQGLKCAHTFHPEKGAGHGILPCWWGEYRGWSMTRSAGVLVGGLGFVPAVRAAPSLPDTAVFPAPALLACRPPPIAILTLLRTGAAIFPFSSVGF